MGRLKVTGLTEYTRKLSLLGNSEKTNRVIKMAIYDGAKVVADAINAEIDTIPVVDKNAGGSPTHPLNGADSVQIEGLHAGLGVATMRQDSDGWDTKVSFSGYNARHTDAYPNGQPNAMIAASIEGGASFRRKNPFITRAVRKAKAQAEAAMEATATKQITEIMEGSTE